MTDKRALRTMLRAARADFVGGLDAVVMAALSWMNNLCRRRGPQCTSKQEERQQTVVFEQNALPLFRVGKAAKTIQIKKACRPGGMRGIRSQASVSPLYVVKGHRTISMKQRKAQVKNRPKDLQFTI